MRRRRRSSSGREREDLLYVALVISLVAEVCSILGDQAVLAALFLLTTLLLCAASWKWDDSA